ncbi:MAG: hypothetical protein HFI90_08555 [Clostridia bacterium]|nr:hypothetical protein [Clostridia bacterium]
MKQLKEVGLITEKRQGLNKPNLIYIGKIDYTTSQENGERQEENCCSSSDGTLIPVDIENVKNKTLKNEIMGNLNIEGQEFEKIKGNNTE